ncbi:MAG TPA: (d)CMP kinase [Fibrobacteria bacterium]|nr:(d)CMP kinase [Fibrobacteria bacterium]
MLPLIAIDGISGAGKSSTAKRVAAELGFAHIDTGAMYRTLTWNALRQSVRPEQHVDLARIATSLEFSFGDDAALRVNGQALSPEIRTPEVSGHVSAYSQAPEVRAAMVAQQRRLGHSRPCVLEGRDIGTVVFPDARWKFFMTANPQTRAKRRVLELQAAGMEASEDEILQNLLERDEKDTNRAHSPLRKADGAVEIDTSGLTMDEQVATITSLVRRDLASHS